MKKMKLILLAAVMLSYHYAQGKTITFTVTNKLKNTVKEVKVGVSSRLWCDDKVHKDLKPGETAHFSYTGQCGKYCFNKIEINGSQVKKGGSLLVRMYVCRDLHMNIVGKEGKHFVVEKQ